MAYSLLLKRHIVLALLMIGKLTPAQAQTPVLTGCTPTRNALIAPTGTDIDLTFSQPIAAPTASGIKVYSAIAGGHKAGTYTTNGATVTFNPTFNFKPGENVQVSVPAAVRSTLDVVAAPQVYQFTTAVGGIGKGNFRLGSDTGAQQYTLNLATGDIDGDGDLDIVTASGLTRQVGVVLNGGDASGSNTGVFSAATVLSPEARAVALADVDGDGDLDLLGIVQSIPGWAFVLLNGGDASGSNTGKFSGGTSVQVGSEPYALAVGDATGTHTGVFSGTQEVAVGVFNRILALADVDNDGDLDILASGKNSTVSIRLNGGDATGSNSGLFSGTQQVAVNGNPLNIAVGDLDGDGDIDFVTANGLSVSVRLNGGNGSGTGAGQFSGTQEVIDGTSYGIALGDVDADGDLDLVFAGETSDNTPPLARVRLNGGDDTGSNTGVFSGGYTPGPIGVSPYTIVLADVDGDNDLDMLSSSFRSSIPVNVRLNQPPPPVIISANPVIGTAGTSVTVTGANLLNATLLVNGAAAVVSTNSATALTFRVPSGAASTGTLTVTTPGGSATVPFTVRLVVTSTSPTANNRRASRNLSTVRVSFSEAITQNSASTLRVYSAQAGGRKTGTFRLFSSQLTFEATVGTPRTNFRAGELISVSVPATIRSTGNIAATKRVFQFTTSVGGTGRGNYLPSVDVSVDSTPFAVTTADVDGDGDLDLIAANDGASGLGNTVSVRLNTGTGTFSGGSELTVHGTASGVIDVTAADVDGDSDLDLLTANTRTNSVSVLLNNGAGVFTLGSNPSVAGSPRRVVTADVDGDGDLDLLTANYDNGNGRTVSVRLNDGTGTFAGGADPEVGPGVLGITTGDIDNDGDLDLLTANAGLAGAGNTVSVRLNDGNGTFSSGSDPAVGINPSSVALGDVDGDGDLDLLTANQNSSTVSVRLNQALPKLTSLSLTSGPVGTSVTLTGTDLSGATGVRFNGTAATTFAVTNSTSVTATVPAGATSGNVTVTTPLGSTNGLPFAVIVTDLTISTPQRVPAGTYRTITVTGPATGGAGVLTLDGPVTITDALTVQPGGTLYTNCQTLTGAGSFTLAGGATLGICDAEGLSSIPSTGAVQTTGSRDFSTSAIYVYNGIESQITGDDLPATVQELVVNSSQGLTLTQPVNIRQRVQLLNDNLNLNGQALTLLSDATGTALVVNSGGVIVGATSTMQRYIGTNTEQSGYRHYSSPVQADKLSTLAAGSYTPDFSGAEPYNFSPTPGLVTPFPTVFAYNQDRIPSSASNYTNFDKGFVAPTSGDEPMEVGRGYAVQAPGNILIDFTGQFNTGIITRSNLNRSKNAQGTDVGMGWHLLGNPYPSPIDWSTMTIGNGDVDNLQGLNAAVYVVQSSGPYTGTYRTYLLNGPNDETSSPIIPAGQGFFVRTTTAGIAGTLRLTDANRVTSFDVPQPAFGRGTTDERPLVRLSVRNAAGTSTDQLTMYADAKATPGVDAAYDATKMSNPSGLNLSAVSATGETLAIDGRPAFTSSTAIALRLSIPTAGTYTLTATSIANLPAGLVAYLRDSATGQQVNMSSQSSTTVTLGAGLSTRYSVVFAAANTLASVPTLTAAQVALYPNPAGQSALVQVTLPVAVGTRVARATVLNALGQVMSQTPLTVQAGQASGSISTTGLATGVYVVRLQAGAEVVSKRLVID